jgi:hypothetical protein
VDTREAAIAALKGSYADQALALRRSVAQATVTDDQNLSDTAMAHAMKGQQAEAKAAFRNATMNLLSQAPAHMDYPPSAEREFLAAVDKLLMGHTVH